MTWSRIYGEVHVRLRVGVATSENTPTTLRVITRFSSLRDVVFSPEMVPVRESAPEAGEKTLLLETASSSPSFLMNVVPGGGAGRDGRAHTSLVVVFVLVLSLGAFATPHRWRVAHEAVGATAVTRFSAPRAPPTARCRRSQLVRRRHGEDQFGNVRLVEFSTLDEVAQI